MNNSPNVNQTATPEIKTEEVAKNKKEKKPKEKKVKEEKPAMDKEYEKWYALALLFLIISLVPYLSRILDPNYDEYKYDDDDKGGGSTPAEVVTKNLNCIKEVTQSNYTYTINITSNYENNKPVNTNISYTVTVSPSSGIDIDSIEIDEYIALRDFQEIGVTTNESDVVKSPEGYDEKIYSVNLNFRNNSDLVNKSELDDHNKNHDIQKENYSKKGYFCSNG